MRNGTKIDDLIPSVATQEDFLRWVIFSNPYSQNPKSIRAFTMAMRREPIWNADEKIVSGRKMDKTKRIIRNCYSFHMGDEALPRIKEENTR